MFQSEIVRYSIMHISVVSGICLQSRCSIHAHELAQDAKWGIICGQVSLHNTPCHKTLNLTLSCRLLKFSNGSSSLCSSQCLKVLRQLGHITLNSLASGAWQLIYPGSCVQCCTTLADLRSEQSLSPQSRQVSDLAKGSRSHDKGHRSHDKIVYSLLRASAYYTHTTVQLDIGNKTFFMSSYYGYQALVLGVFHY